MTNSMLVSRAVALAADVHRNQVDLAGEPYILHPLRVMFRVQAKWPTHPDLAVMMAVAVLHDVIEDGGEKERWSIRLWELTVKVDYYASKGVGILTRQPDEDYDAYIKRVSVDPIARRVKLMDLEDNLNPERLRVLRGMGKANPERENKYRQALAFLDRADFNAGDT